MSATAAMPDLAEPWPWPPGTPTGDAWREAGEAWGRRLDAEARRGLRPGSPDWRLFAPTLADQEVLPATLAALGFAHRVRTHAEPPPWFPNAAGPVLEVAEAPDEPPTLAVEAYLGRWSRLPVDGVMGADLIELAAVRFGMTRGRAAFHLARLLGRDVPRVPA